MFSGAPPTLLGRCLTNDHRHAAGARERYGIVGDGLVDQAHDRRTSECGRAFQVDRAMRADRSGHTEPSNLANRSSQFLWFQIGSFT